MDTPPPPRSLLAREISSSAVVCYGKPAPGVNVTHQLITFFKFAELKDPNAEVERPPHRRERTRGGPNLVSEQGIQRGWR